MSAFGHQHDGTSAVNYSVFPTPPPQSPLRESPLTGYPPLRHYGGAGYRNESDEGRIKQRGGDFKVSDTVVSPHYKGRMSYPPVVDAPNSEAPIEGVHLFHFPSSLPSMKARMVLYEKSVAWKSHVVDLAKHEHYEPCYIQMNQRAVLPTLTADGRVTTDDSEILYYVNSTFPGIDLVPNSSSEKGLMEYFIDLLSKQNVEALAFGHVPGVKKRTGKSPFPGRRHRIHQLMDQYQTSHYAEVYKNKEVVNNYQEDIVCDPNKMRLVFGNIESCLSEIEHQLSHGPFHYGGWLISDQFTLADISALCLLRFLDLLGLKSLMNTQTLRYYEQGKTRQSFIDAGDNWFSAWKIFCANHLPTTLHKVGFFGTIVLLALLLLGAIGAGIWGLVKWFTPPPPPPVIIEAPRFIGLRGDVIDVVGMDHMYQGAHEPWMKWALMIFPLLLFVPICLWFFGCIKCSKRGSDKPKSKPKPAPVIYTRSISSSDQAVVAVHTERHTEALVIDGSDGVLVMEDNHKDVVIMQDGSDSSDALIVTK